MDLVITLLKELSADKKLLIVEDDADIAQSLYRLLSSFFKKSFIALNVSEAIEIFEIESKNSTLLILTDINLGNKSGIDLTCYVKKANPLQRVIAISATDNRAIFIDSIECGVDKFVLKPIDMQKLFEALISVLKKIDYDQELQKSRKLLEESKEYALKLLKEQDQFLKNAIHEIHTPLAVIITNIDLLRMSEIDNEFLNAIEAGSYIIQNSYEDMTYLMKSNKVADVKTNIDIVDFISKRKKYFNCIAEVNNLSISMFIGQPNFPMLYFSELKLTRLIDNTLSNAIKYSYRPSEINITIGMYENKLFFEIRNHGPIIQNKKDIFKRFYRESEHKGGYGLGLSIVAQICEEENIDIKILSNKTRGTSFKYIFNIATNLQQTLSTISVE
ncbi:MAG: hybrid sensor histidine kinase/response regulator [Sulfurimonas sp. RIFOXYD12_FULL_33_39]|uniref:hybrid sensor histidine kinase/response regulator n=1 Tax=unclassified Sulfurimonas TaxID=2623549 RepID=UPI0008BF744D|nr:MULTISPECIES: hybrid sensor histidine kinase/response regulator [unclassified Sulfurimonas]OHE09196.1 MAG: hybrid sensor histidine kinase/response regulator [Sulfurimonas sp. RIFOXYD12_FULL_33_39]OHE13021.1 MAG: hybrid sensor histidine kinase/response regulator [Sulfurimonas sp. RIFOXYD2_FULL_34_21]